MKDFYYTLGVDSNCGAGEIKDAYRKLSKKFHPDLNEGDQYFVRRFREINEAYETLNDPAKRFQYDGSLKKIRSKKNIYRHPDYDNQVRESTFVKKGTKRGGHIFTVTWIAAAIILGAYLLKSVTDYKKTRIIVEKETSEPAVNIPKHHKSLHISKAKINHESPRPHKDTAAVKPVKSEQPVSDINNHNFLYVTNVHANLTGVVNMRLAGDFNSAIIAKIPANSRVFILKRGDAYYRVSFNNSTGYIPKWSLKEK